MQLIYVVSQQKQNLKEEQECCGTFVELFLLCITAKLE